MQKPLTSLYNLLGPLSINSISNLKSKKAQKNKPSKKLSALCFQLSALSFLLSAFGLNSCSFNPNTQGKGEVYLQGEWQQQQDTIHKKLETYAIYHFKFDCDSFYLQIKSFSKVNYGADSCMKSGQWTEYTRGTYKQKTDTIYLKGQFCNRDFSLKDVGECFRAGDYSEAFRVLKKTDSLVQLTGIADVVPMNIRLEKRTICHQKPL